MKKVLVAQAIWLLLAGSLVTAIAYPEQPGFLSVASVLIWTLTVILLLAVVMSATTVSSARTGDKAAIERLRTWVKSNPKRGVTRATLSWIQNLSLVLLSAYCGLVVAAPLLLICSALVKFGHDTHREEVAKIDAAAKDADA